MKTSLLFFAIITLALNSCDKHWSDPTLNETDKNFMIVAASHNLNEIEAGALAHNKAVDKSVLAFADKMEFEHREAQRELTTVVESGHLNLHYNENLETMKLQMIQLNGRLFDSTYVHTHLNYQRDIIKIFQNEIDNGKDEGLKYYASKYINHIKLYNEHVTLLAQKF